MPAPGSPGLRACFYRLPTEAEWEYAARGRYYYYLYPWGSNSIDFTMLTYNSNNPLGLDHPYTTPVGYYTAFPLQINFGAGSLSALNNAPMPPESPRTAQERFSRQV